MCVTLTGVAQDTAASSHQSARGGKWAVAEPDPGIPHLAEKLNDLYDIPGPGGIRRTHQQVADELADRFGIVVSAQHLAYLTTGKRTNPSAKLLWGLAQIFGVPMDHFFDTSPPKQPPGRRRTRPNQDQQRD